MMKLMNNLLFPLRAVFMGDKGRLGLMSLRQERMEFVSRFCRGRVLDVGCGPHNLFIKNYIGEESGVGIDVFPYAGVKNVVEDMTKLPFKDSSFDTITLIAAVSHIPKPKRMAEFKEFSRLLKPGGLLVVTEGELVTQTLIHKWEEIRKTGLDYERGMEKDEEYCMPQKELLGYLNTSPLRLVKKVLFMWGLNNVYISKKND